MGRSIEEIKEDIKRNKEECKSLLKELDRSNVEKGTYLDEWDDYVKMCRITDNLYYYVVQSHDADDKVHWFSGALNFVVKGKDCCARRWKGYKEGFYADGIIRLGNDKKWEDVDDAGSSVQLYEDMFAVLVKGGENEDWRLGKVRDAVMENHFGGREIGAEYSFYNSALYVLRSDREYRLVKPSEFLKALNEERNGAGCDEDR